MALGAGVEAFCIGDRVGIPWLGHTCGTCAYCRDGRENLCDHPQFTGATRDGGFATHVVADAHYCFALPEGLSDAVAAPLLCAGLIGWRAYHMAGDGKRIGLYGFGAAPLAPLASFPPHRQQAIARNTSCGMVLAYEPKFRVRGRTIT